MQAIDFSKLLSGTPVQEMMPPEAEFDENIYPGKDGVRFQSRLGKKSFIQEIMRLADGAFLLVSQDSSCVVESYHQVVSDGDWVHIQFRLSGGGHEYVDQADLVETPESSCIVARYPENSVIERTVDAKTGWKVACLFVKPAALSKLVGVAPLRLPESAEWLARDEHLELRSSILPLQSSMKLAVNDMLTCTFRGLSRQIYMRAKSLELLSPVIHSLEGRSPTHTPTLNLTESDVERISLAHSIMLVDLESTLTLAELARRVGVNRTKLALGFKGMYGIPVQAFWRDAKLDRARKMLRDRETPVTAVALSLGYAELSSFTRAFIRKFGVTPRDCRADAQPAHRLD